LLLRATDTERAKAVIEALEWARLVSREGESLLVEAPAERASEISRALAEAEVYLHELRPREGTLEEFFLEVTEPEAPGG
jgi:ABC-2 type transport system ATP-binding protein